MFRKLALVLIGPNAIRPTSQYKEQAIAHRCCGDAMSDTRRKVAIVGAGITGLAAADLLVREGLDVQVFDKGRAPGGRIASRRTPSAVYDHGAPQLDAEGTDFADLLRSLGALRSAANSFVGSPCNRALMASFASGVSVLSDVRISSLKREADGWVLKTDGGRGFANFDSVLLTAPAPQARDLVVSCDASLAKTLEVVRMHPVWTCMIEFAQDLPDFRLPENGPVLRADRMGDKPGREDVRSAWVIHMTPEYTETNLNTDAMLVAPQVLKAFAETCGVQLPAVRHLDAHLWRYAYVDRPFGQPFLSSSVPGLIVGGDWTLGRRAEDGFRSGRAMAQTVLSRMAEAV